MAAWLSQAVLLGIESVNRRDQSLGQDFSLRNTKVFKDTFLKNNKPLCLLVTGKGRRVCVFLDLWGLCWCECPGEVWLQMKSTEQNISRLMCTNISGMRRIMS